MIVFDLDDTLYLERDFASSGYRHLEEFVSAALFAAGERRNVLGRACQEMGIPAEPGLIAALVAEYRGHAPEISLCPDAARWLGRAQGPLGLITDGPAAMQQRKIAALGLPALIRHIRATGAWGAGFGKPHPRAYQEMEALAAPRTAAEMAYVADNPAKDFLTPRARGWKTVQILRPGAVHDPAPPSPAHAAAARIQSLDELTPVLAAL